MTPRTHDPDQVKVNDSFHWLAMLLPIGYAWQLHGIGLALTLLVCLPLIIAGTNIAVLAFTGSLAALGFNRWAWIVVAFVGLAASSATIETASDRATENGAVDHQIG